MSEVMYMTMSMVMFGECTLIMVMFGVYSDYGNVWCTLIMVMFGVYSDYGNV